MMICSKRFLESVSGTYKFIRVTRKGLQEKSLQSRSATASLLIKNYQCMKEEISLLVLLAQKSRHIV